MTFDDQYQKALAAAAPGTHTSRTNLYALIKQKGKKLYVNNIARAEIIGSRYHSRNHISGDYRYRIDGHVVFSPPTVGVGSLVYFTDAVREAKNDLVKILAGETTAEALATEARHQAEKQAEYLENKKKGTP